MAPEQHQGLRGDARSDVWALGVLLYEMVTGSEPFVNADPTVLRADILSTRYIPAARRRPSLPRPVVHMISVCLRLKPGERYASAGVMLRAAQQLRRRLASGVWRPLLTVPPAAIAAGLGALALALLVYAFVPSSDVNVAKSTGGAAAQPVAAPVAGGGAAAGANSPDRAAASSAASPARPAPVAAATPVPAAARRQDPPAATPEYRGEEERTVRVATYDGEAEVVDGAGRVLGKTPYPLSGPLGKSYELWLRRPGFQPRRVDVQINVNKTEYLYGLEKSETRPDFKR
jgi:hypothetical protein